MGEGREETGRWGGEIKKAPSRPPSNTRRGEQPSGKTGIGSTSSLRKKKEKITAQRQEYGTAGRLQMGGGGSLAQVERENGMGGEGFCATSSQEKNLSLKDSTVLYVHGVKAR